MTTMRAIVLIFVLSACTTPPPLTKFPESKQPIAEGVPLYEIQGIDWQPKLRVEYNDDGSQRVVEVKD